MKDADQDMQCYFYIEQNRALHDGLIYISASPLVAVLFFVYDYSINISAKEKAL